MNRLSLKRGLSVIKSGVGSLRIDSKVGSKICELLRKSM